MSDQFESGPGLMTVPPPPKNKPPKESDYSFHISRGAAWALGFIILAIAVAVGVLVTKLSDKDSATPSNAVAQAKARPTEKAETTSLAVATVRPTADSSIKVFVTGEVQKPGVYSMRNGERIEDAIQAAGGYTEQADPSRLDLAQRVKDEMRIDVPRLTVATTAAANSTLPVAVAAIAPTVAPISGSVSTPADGKININTATAAELDKLPGIGAVLSQRIIDYRVKNGPFRTLDDVRKVSGLSKSVVDKLKDLITF